MQSLAEEFQEIKPKILKEQIVLVERLSERKKLSKKEIRRRLKEYHDYLKKAKVKESIDPTKEIHELRRKGRFY